MVPPYLIQIIYYTKFITVQTIASIAARSLNGTLKTSFLRFSIPEKVVCHNGPPFDSREFEAFLSDRVVRYNPSRPYNPISNESAERVVQTTNHSLIKTKYGKYLVMVNPYYRSMRVGGLKSSAELLMGGKLRTLLQTLPGNLLPTYNCRQTQMQLQQRQVRQQCHGDLKKKTLSPLLPKQDVWFKGKVQWNKGVIFSKDPNERLQTVQWQEGRSYRRNRPCPGLQRLRACIVRTVKCQQEVDVSWSATATQTDNRVASTELFPQTVTPLWPKKRAACYDFVLL